jgi:exonuclease SbcC
MFAPVDLKILRKKEAELPAVEKKLAGDRAELERLKMLSPKEEKLRECAKAAKDLGAELKQREKELAQAEIDLRRCEGRIKALQKSTADADKPRDELARLSSRFAETDKLYSILKRKKDAEEKLDALRREEKEIRTRLDSENRREARLKAEKEAALSANLAMTLKAGLPCPVCGSTHHPEPAAASAFTQDDELNSAAESAAELRDGLAANSEAQKQRAESVNSCLAEMQEHNPLQSGALVSIEETEKIMREILDGKSRLEKIISENKNSLETLKSLESEQNGLAQKATAAKAANDEIVLKKTAADSETEMLEKDLAVLSPKARQNIASAAAEIEKSIGGQVSFMKEIDASIRKALELSAGFSQAADSIRERLARLKEKSAEAVPKVNQAAAGAGFDSIAHCEKAVRSNEEMDSMNRRVLDYRDARKEVEVRLEALAGQTSGMEKPDLDRMNLAKTAIENEIGRAESEKGMLAEAISSAKKKLEDIERLKISITELIEETRAVSELADGLIGRNPKNINFQSFILAAYLREAAEYASKRLLRMTDGRYRFIVTEEIIHGNKQAGLDLDVFDSFTGQQRSVRTLSGGEKFMAAISLSLALADVIQSRSASIELDAVFIDEGFGSLDDESLDKALSILDEIRGGRMVGIISHVQELKNRIPSQINIVKGAAGSAVSAKR